jgi:hypothetical protein
MVQIQIPVGMRFSAPVYTPPPLQGPPSCLYMGNEAVPGGEAAKAWQ